MTLTRRAAATAVLAAMSPLSGSPAAWAAPPDAGAGAGGDAGADAGLPAVFDAHFHIIDPRFPLVANQGYLPPPFTTADYRAATAALRVAGGAVVSGSFQAVDQRYLLDALARLGPGFVGVTQLAPSATDAQLRQLDAAGVRALRFNLFRGGADGLAELEALAQRVWQLVGWHVELYIDSAAIAPIRTVLARLPMLSIDHLGMSAAGLPDVLWLVERGAWVKASGFGRVDLDVADTLRRICAVDASRLVFGSDLPSTRARRPFEPADVALIRHALTPEQAHGVMSTNGRRLYRLPPG